MYKSTRIVTRRVNKVVCMELACFVISILFTFVTTASAKDKQPKETMPIQAVGETSSRV